MLISIGVWCANKEQVCFLDSCGIIYKKIENENDVCSFSHVFLFKKIPHNKFKKGQTIIDCRENSFKTFVKTIMLPDEQIDVFSFCNITKNERFGGLFYIKIVDGITFALCSIPMKIISQSFVINKGFHFFGEKFPAEEIPLRDNGGLQRLFLSAMIYLFNSQNIPFVIKSFSPVSGKIPFMFRIDTDFTDKKTIENYRKNIKSDFVFTWFVHCNVFENSLEFFNTSPNDEIALHCFSHKVKPTNENLRKGINLLKNFGKNSLGYAAPYGVRNETADVFLKKNFCFEYSSDFSFSSDSLPFFVEKTGLWQIPVFPLCIGSFNGLNYYEDSVIEVFERYFERQAKYEIPFILYDHPNHNKFNLLNKIFEKAIEYPILPMTFIDYCRFLRKRQTAEIEINIDSSGKIVSNSDFPLTIFYSNEKKQSKFVPMKKISRFSIRLIKNTIINHTRRKKHDK
ncbi:MAG: hypothetical protein LBH98_02315 [Chitinispirillales bacterium]|jgi:hypothetical protein|nr:hypothetical protein [Chitinispirillales bacterium]